MKINQLLLSVFLILLLSLSVSAVGLFPQPVTGTVTLPGFQTLEGLDLYQKNLNTGVEIKTDLDSSGYFVVDWSNIGYLDGHVVEISLGICKENAFCQRRVVLNTGSPIYIDLQVPSNFQVLKEMESV